MMRKKEVVKIESFEYDMRKYFLRDVFSNYLVTKTHIDNKINWLMGASGIITSFTLQHLIKSENNSLGIIIIFIGGLLSFLACLVNLDYPAFLTKKSHDSNNIMFYKSIKGKTVNEIYAELKKIDSFDKILMQYSVNMHNLTERNIAVKAKLFNLSRNILFVSMILGVIIIAF